MIALLFLFSGCVQPEVQQGVTESVVSEEWQPDGILGGNEYSHSLKLYSPARQGYTGGAMTVSWKIDDEYLYMALNGSTRGWLAIGFEPTEWMKDADMVLGFVDGSARVLDEYSTGNYGPHINDTMLGGTDDILEYGGKSYGTHTVVEFRRKLDTGDRFDKVLRPGQNVSIIWAMSGSMDPGVKHNIAYGEGMIYLGRVQSSALQSSQKASQNNITKNVTQNDADWMLFIWKEEKAARDLYESFYERTGLTLFLDLMRSEQNHMDQIQALMKRYGMETPVLERGVFDNQTLQSIYNDLLSISSDDGALRAAATFEEISILDLERAIAETGNKEIIDVYSGLLAGSRKHLRSYVRTLENRGIKYTPVYMSRSEFEGIVRAA
ncbi:MAG TPA: DUF2202 domain-containing protein [Methanothrix sp.]|nr:DUF2202 domain-containing protein [Methanothrix sp.]HOK58514.1 DUF2202 domain-containing protein [Methanothrix sp.]HOL43683.1 DUF2202 domain-containing protein [Methanothrix sp.]HPO88758.1 DUF2202 domain-containing protein [Methanothrix sp.]